MSKLFLIVSSNGESNFINLDHVVRAEIADKPAFVYPEGGGNPIAQGQRVRTLTLFMLPHDNSGQGKNMFSTNEQQSIENFLGLVKRNA